MANALGNRDEIQTPLVVGTATGGDFVDAQEDIALLLQDNLVGSGLDLVNRPDALAVGGVAVVIGAIPDAVLLDCSVAVDAVQTVVPGGHCLPGLGHALLADGGLHTCHGNAVGVGDAAGKNRTIQVFVVLEGHVAVDVGAVDGDVPVPCGGKVLVKVVPAVGAAVPAHVHVVEPAAVVGAVSVNEDCVSRRGAAQVDCSPDGDREGAARVKVGADDVHLAGAAGNGVRGVSEASEARRGEVGAGFARIGVIVVHADGHARIPEKAANHAVVLVAGLLELRVGALGARLVNHK